MLSCYMFRLEARQVGSSVCWSRHPDRVTKAKITVVALDQFSRASTSPPTLASANYFLHLRDRAKIALANPLGISTLQTPHFATGVDSHTCKLPGGIAPGIMLPRNLALLELLIGAMTSSATGTKHGRHCPSRGLLISIRVGVWWRHVRSAKKSLPRGFGNLRMANWSTEPTHFLERDARLSDCLSRLAACILWTGSANDG
jgi:hypothetical protein